MRLTLATLAKHSLVANQSKCEFSWKYISYLGHQVSNAGVEVDSNKIDAIASWPLPTSVCQLRGFLGLVGYYRQFV